MAANLLLAALLNVLTFLVHGVGLISITYCVGSLLKHPVLRAPAASSGFGLAALAFGIFVLMCLETSIWAIGMVAIGMFADFTTAFYFSTSAFATIGFSDVLPSADWRLLGALEGITGLLIMGWSAAYLVTSSLRFGPFEREKHF